jgi:hypothetical protein
MPFFRVLLKSCAMQLLNFFGLTYFSYWLRPWGGSEKLFTVVINTVVL